MNNSSDMITVIIIVWIIVGINTSIWCRSTASARNDFDHFLVKPITHKRPILDFLLLNTMDKLRYLKKQRGLHAPCIFIYLSANCCCCCWRSAVSHRPSLGVAKQTVVRRKYLFAAVIGCWMPADLEVSRDSLKTRLSSLASSFQRRRVAQRSPGQSEPSRAVTAGNKRVASTRPRPFHAEPSGTGVVHISTPPLTRRIAPLI